MPRVGTFLLGLVLLWLGIGTQLVALGDGRLSDDEKPDEASLQSDHWSFQPIASPTPPEVENQQWVRTPIDAFVLHRLEREGIAPSPEADRYTLIRRLSLDLLGLPPTPAEVDAFVNDTRPDAYRRLVDRLLASPHFGERWGRHWLDLARYADSDGYEKDLPRPWAWRWRNWVIGAINNDMPFDQFTVEQLAGDLLPDATLNQKVATGFHRNTLTNREGGVDREEDRVKIGVDRVNTTGTVWLGLTIGCCQCHDHKYDPLTQHDFYELFAFFNATNEADISAPLPEEFERYQVAKKAFDTEHEQLVAKVKAYESDELPAKQTEWEAHVQADPALKLGWQVLEPASFASAGGAGFRKLDDASVMAGDFRPDKDTYTIVINTKLKPITALRLEMLTEPSLPKSGPGRADNGNFVLSELTVTAAPQGDPTQARPIALTAAAAEHAQKDFPVAAAIDNDPKTGWAVDQGGTSRTAIFQTAEDVAFEQGTTLVVTLSQLHGTHHVIGRFRLSAATAARDRLALLPDNEVVPILAVPEQDRTEQQRSAVSTFYATIDPGLAEMNKAVDNHAKQAPPYPATKAQTLVQNAEPPKTHIHIRGDFLRKGDEVQPGVPAVLPSLPAGGEMPNRLDLAKWIVDPANPLTARVAVNRIWQHLFGRGLVATPEDFGTRGEPPSHPELLDWLASQYMNKGWSRKEMIRLIVQSSTYRQSSQTRDDLEQRDPKNVLLARQNRYRLSSEVVRDLYLAASGLLEPALGGPSVRPPLPAGVASLGYANSVKWSESPAPDKYRRGLYVFFQRTVPYPMLTTFDSPDSNVTCTRRERSNTPLQALTLLNDPVFVECAQAMGRRVVAEGPGDLEGRLRFAFRLCVSREPAEQELDRLETLYAELLALCEDDPGSAARLTGNYHPENMDAAEAATWVALARTLLNLDEFVTRE